MNLDISEGERIFEGEGSISRLQAPAIPSTAIANSKLAIATRAINSSTLDTPVYLSFLSPSPSGSPVKSVIHRIDAITAFPWLNSCVWSDRENLELQAYETLCSSQFWSLLPLSVSLISASPLKSVSCTPSVSGTRVLFAQRVVPIQSRQYHILPSPVPLYLPLILCQFSHQDLFVYTCSCQLSTRTILELVYDS